MAEFLRFWQRLPRLAFGLASLVTLSLAIIGKDRLVRLADSLAAFNLTELPGVLSGILSVFILLTAGSIGIFILELLVGAFGVVTRRLSEVPSVLNTLRTFDLTDIVVPVDRLVLEVYQRDRSHILQFFRLRSEATPGHQKEAEELKQFYEGLGDHLDSIRDPALLIALAYYTSLTQDQAKIEQWEFTVKDFYYFLLFLGSMLTFGLRMDISLEVAALLLTLLLTAAVVSLPLIRDRKRRLAALLLAAYCDNFTVAEGASIADRGDL